MQFAQCNAIVCVIGTVIRSHRHDVCRIQQIELYSTHRAPVVVCPQHSSTKVCRTISAINSRYNLSTFRILNRLDLVNTDFFDTIEKPKLISYLSRAMEGTCVNRIVDEKFWPERYNKLSICTSTHCELPRMSLR